MNHHLRFGKPHFSIAPRPKKRIPERLTIRQNHLEHFMNMQNVSARKLLTMNLASPLCRILGEHDTNGLLWAIDMAKDNTAKDINEGYDPIPISCGSIAGMLCFIGDVPTRILQCSYQDGEFEFKVRFGATLFTDDRIFVLQVVTLTSVYMSPVNRRPRYSRATLYTENQRDPAARLVPAQAADFELLCGVLGAYHLQGMGINRNPVTLAAA